MRTEELLKNLKIPNMPSSQSTSSLTPFTGIPLNNISEIWQACKTNTPYLEGGSVENAVLPNSG
jgi:hypothetical protein